MTPLQPPTPEPQATLARAVYAEHRDEINASILKIAGDYLISGYDLDHEYAYNLMFNDGMWTPWQEVKSPIADEYDECIAEHGNADQEEAFLSTVWCYVLTNLTPAETRNLYLPIVAKFLDIQVNGL